MFSLFKRPKLLGDPKDLILDFYRTQEPQKKKPLVDPVCALENLNFGLGDTMSLSHLPKKGKAQGKKLFIFSKSPHFKSLTPFIPDYEPPPETLGFTQATVLQKEYACGAGHFFQRLERACGLVASLKPQGCLSIPLKPKTSKIVLHLSVGPHALHQKKTIHKKAREFYPKHRKTLQRFIQDCQHCYAFVEVGTEFSQLEGVENRCGLSLEKTLEELSAAQFFIGMNSGVMHLAAALDIPSIIIVNFPKPQELYLPALKDVPIADIDWLYPQNVHLHEDGDGPLAKLFSYENLKKAIDGKIYPFWTDAYLSLKQEAD